MTIGWVAIVGTIGAAASVDNFTRQTPKIISERSSEGLSLGMFALPKRKTEEVAEALDPER